MESIKGKRKNQDNILNNLLVFRDEKNQYHGKAIEYVIGMFSQVDKGSDFEMMNRDLLSLPKQEIVNHISEFKDRGYEVMLSYLPNKIIETPLDFIGHIAFQEHMEDKIKNWQVFHHYIKNEEREKGYGTAQAKNLLEYARENGIYKVRMSKGDNNRVKGIVQRLYDKKDELNIEVDLEDHWVRLLN
ncbi:MAG: GNAT family N-acetyltransferase [Nanoarchaeota archaeon]|nr:GNAT family N-acetyltransferase [Nanoarchaeota archaeon]